MNRKTLLLFLVALFALLPCLTKARAKDESRYCKRWFYSMHNLLVGKNVDDLIKLIQRAGKSGYNGLVLADYKLNILDRMPREYFAHVARVRKAAAIAGIEIIPAVFPMGYSAGLLAHDPNLAEGLPVKDSVFVVNGHEAILVPDSVAKLRNASLEEVNGNRFAGLSFQDDPGKSSFADREIVHHGRVSCRMQEVGKNNPHGHCRLVQNVKVRPHACYRFSCWIKTRNFNPGNAFRLLALGTNEIDRELTFYEGTLKATQDWSQVDIVFNSLGQNEVILYAGQWGGKTGTLWIDDLALEELALVNVLRRDGCPLQVVSDNGKTFYEEGKDFLPIQDPKLGREPYAGEYSFRHEGAKLRLAEGSRIKDGDRLRVSWYHPILTHGSQVTCCLTEPKVYELLRDQAKRVNNILEPQTFFMSHDEIRVAGWCRSCRDTHSSPGALLANNVHRCADILKGINPKARIVVWSDMFDPFHNAVGHYYLANGSMTNSWKGLSPETIIANWNGGKGQQSLKWFADRGHPQIMAGYYDAGLENFKSWENSAKNIPGVTGFMYTTWQQKYQDLEAYGKAMLAGTDNKDSGTSD